MENAFNEQTLLEKRCSQLEDKFNKLSQNNDNCDESQTQTIPELVSLRSENLKLKYRVNILKNSIEEEIKHQLNDNLNLQSNQEKESNPIMNGMNSKQSTERKGMKSILGEIRSLFGFAISESYPRLNNPPLLVSRSDHADYQCNSALPLSKFIADRRLSPRDVANNIVKHLPKNQMIGSVVVAGPGFLNITLNKDYVCNSIKDIVINGVYINGCIDGENEMIVIDYSSPNIAKEMHVGHLRSTIIGDAFANIMQFIGHKVLRVNHIGDWGTQFGMLLTHLIDKYPNYMENPPPISDLQSFYKESKKRFDDEPEFKKRAYNTTVRLQAKEQQMIIAWKLICDISRKEFQEVYKILDISEDLQERGESYYHELMVEVVKDLEAKNLLEEDEGRKVLFANDKNDLPPMTIVKSDGGFTYDTSDLATLRQRVQQENASRIIYAVDAGQSQHFQILFGCASRAGYYDPQKVRVDHLSFGVVLGEDKKKFKTRSGDTVRLKSLIEEGLERSLAKLIEKERDKVLTPEELKAAQYAVAIGCIKYADLSHDRNHEYVFSFDRMLDDRGNTAVYLLYALTRIRSIIRKAELTQSVEQLAKDLPQLELDHPREYKLSKFILRFAEVILQMADDMYLHTLCNYLFELSVVFSEFYDQCYCIEKIKIQNVETTKVNINRIILCEATARVIETGLLLLGIKSVDKM